RAPRSATHAARRGRSAARRERRGPAGTAPRARPVVDLRAGGGGAAGAGARGPGAAGAARHLGRTPDARVRGRGRRRVTPAERGVGAVKRLSVVILNWNGLADTRAALASLARCAIPPGWSVDLRVVDNGSTDGSVDAVRREFPA